MEKPSGEPPEFRAFLEETPWHADFGAHPPASDAEVEMVLVEPRAHPLLVPVLRNVSHMFPNLALTVVHSAANAGVLRDLLTPNVCLLPLLPPDLTVDQYSRLLTSPFFWHALTAPRILIFQTDAGVFRNTILDFLEYDYVGAPWRVSWCPRASGEPCYVGNGGLSLRSRVAMLEASVRGDAASFPFAEDVFFARTVPAARVAPPEVATQFSAEMVLSYRPMGFHKVWDVGHSPQQVATFFARNARFARNEAQRRDVQIVRAWTSSEGVEKSDDSDTNSDDLRRWLRLGVSATGFWLGCGALLPVPASTTVLHIAFQVDGEDIARHLVVQRRRTLTPCSINSPM